MLASLLVNQTLFRTKVLTCRSRKTTGYLILSNTGIMGNLKEEEPPWMIWVMQHSSHICQSLITRSQFGKKFHVKACNASFNWKTNSKNNMWTVWRMEVKKALLLLLQWLISHIQPTCCMCKYNQDWARTCRKTLKIDCSVGLGWGRPCLAAGLTENNVSCRKSS